MPEPDLEAGMRYAAARLAPAQWRTALAPWGTYQWGGYDQPPEAGERPDPLAPPDGYDHDRPRGTHPDPDPDSGQIDMTRCRLAPAVTGVMCGKPATVHVWWGDAAEHVFPVPYCTQCLAVIRSFGPTSTCTTCQQPMQMIKIEHVGEAAEDPQLQRLLDGVFREGKA